MIIVIDTNIWLSELGLNSPQGSATRFYLRQNKARIALPEVVRLEVEHNLRNRLKDFIDIINNNYRQLLAVFGNLKEIVLPNNDAIELRVASIFDDVAVDIIDVPFTFDSAKKSFIKTIDKVPPCDKTQEFKDGVLWADCVELLKQDDVYLVTSDKAFYQDRDYNKGLAKYLITDISGAIHSLKILSSLSYLLGEIKTEVDIDTNILLTAFIDKFGKSVNGTLDRNKFELGDRISLKKVLYVTEKPNNLFIEFTILCECKDLAGEDRTECTMTLRGDGIYNIETHTFESLRNFGEELNFKEGDREKQIRNVVMYVGGLYLGHKEIVHIIRQKIV
jgi:predicted nucleic acid-binding protein